MLGIGERTLYKVLRSAGQPSPGALLRAIRVERAHRRLSVALPVDVDRIAFEEGFPSTRRFREAYREHYGRSPVQMREHLLSCGPEGLPVRRARRASGRLIHRARRFQARTPGRNLGTRMLTLVPAPGAVSTTRP
ncbi:helix-turn-helix domain-containing protein [Nocardia acidivorans]|uniref:helix-turn-helix domain-containing protein n=1 Tax=Nocardia acidivorans TaxID=404580 RepID=UPI0035A24828